MIAKRKEQNKAYHNTQEKQIPPKFNQYSDLPQKEPSEPQTKERIVLAELNKGAKTFENIQKNTGFDSKEINTILEDLEKKGMLKVHQKQGLFGSKIELYPTDKGVKEYYS